MRSEVQEYINRVKDNDRSLTVLKIIPNNLDGFDQLINIFKDRAAIAEQIVEFEMSGFTTPLTLNLIMFKNLRKLTLSSSVVENLYLPLKLEEINISPDKCSINVCDLVFKLKAQNLCTVSYDSDGSVYSADVAEYDDVLSEGEQEDLHGNKQIQEIAALLFSSSLNDKKEHVDPRHNEEAEPQKKMRRMGSLGQF